MLAEYVPGGYTPKFQVMDVGINCPFKVHFQQSYNEAQQDFILMHGEEIKAASS